MSSVAESTVTRFHLSLNVSDLDRSVQFFKTLFGTDPAKQRSDYAKFELLDPPLVLSLEPLLDDQESDARLSTGAIYWEGAVRALEGGRPVGRGYLELTGYGEPLRLR